MTTSIEWKRRIVQLVQVKQRLADVDTERLWEYRLPGVAADEEQLAAVEEQLGEPLDPSYRGYLTCGGGWPSLFQTIDLLGAADLLGGPTFEQGRQRLSYLEPAALSAAGAHRNDLLPIAVSLVDLDLVVMQRRAAAEPGTVIWFAGAEVDRYPTFDDFFLAMIEYNVREIEHLSTR